MIETESPDPFTCKQKKIGDILIPLSNDSPCVHFTNSINFKTELEKSIFGYNTPINITETLQNVDTAHDTRPSNHRKYNNFNTDGTGVNSLHLHLLLLEHPILSQV